jgi:hypothetical protein
MADCAYDRESQDVGNILALEHVNVRIPDQTVATVFYVLGLGLTRDPYVMVGTDNMWINAGDQQFHLPTGSPQVTPGYVGLVVPDLDALAARLASVRGKLGGTAFGYAVEDKHVLVTCPWGNRFRCYAPGPQFGDMLLGIPYVEFLVKPGSAEGIGRFYREVLRALATVVQEREGAVARVQMWRGQWLIFRETTQEVQPYDGHHIAVYIANFSGPHTFLQRHGLITGESDAHQYRFQDIVHPETGEKLFTVEHEVRSLSHPRWGRELVNRNAAQTQRAYLCGRDTFLSAGPPR